LPLWTITKIAHVLRRLLDGDPLRRPLGWFSLPRPVVKQKFKRCAQSSHGWTVVEVVIVVILIGILLALLLPALQSARESQRLALCTHKMQRLIAAVHSYEMAEQRFPPGTINDTGPIENLPRGKHIGWIARLLPNIDQQVAYDNLDLSASAYAPVNYTTRQLTIAALICPADVNLMMGLSSYTASHHDREAPIASDNNGVFFLNDSLSYDDLQDGAAYTIFLSEKCTDVLRDLGWLSGTPGTLRNAGLTLSHQRYQAGANASVAPWLEINAVEEENPDVLACRLKGGNPKEPFYVGGFGSYHVSGANFAMGNGAVKFLTDDISMKLLSQLANRYDGKVVSAEQDP